MAEFTQNDEIVLAVYEKANKTYGSLNLPYKIHIKMCLDAHNKFKHLIPSGNDVLWVRYAILMHDMIEDCGCNYNDIIDLLFVVESHSMSYDTSISKFIADIVYNVSNELGKTRSERIERTYPKIKGDFFATYVKLCDRIANTSWSKYIDSSPRMFNKYKAEYGHFRRELFLPELVTMFDYLDNMYATTNS